MRCSEIENMAWTDGAADELEASVLEHIEHCDACRSYVKGLVKLRAGFGALARETAPEPSWGFSDRVLRRLREERAPRTPEFLENAGRRVILAALVLVFTLLLAMILPSSGPVRHEPTMESYWSQTESVTATAASYPVDWTGGVPPAPVLVMPAVDHGDR